MRLWKNTIIIGIVMACFALPAYAGDGHHGHHPDGAVQDLYAPAMDKMHKDMMVKPSGDADVDFVRGMIPHHQGAVDMAKIVLEHGKDPEIRALAQDVISAQEKEIKFMQDWLKARGL